MPLPKPAAASAIPCVYHTPNCLFTKIAPAGVEIISALQLAADQLQTDLWITSACDGAHSGEEDPHHTGEAYDVRSHDFAPEDKLQVLTAIMASAGPIALGASLDGVFTEHFFGWLEAAGTPKEHFHIQRRKGTVYP